MCVCVRGVGLCVCFLGNKYAHLKAVARLKSLEGVICLSACQALMRKGAAVALWFGIQMCISVVTPSA